MTRDRATPILTLLPLLVVPLWVSPNGNWSDLNWS